MSVRSAATRGLRPALLALSLPLLALPGYRVYAEQRLGAELARGPRDAATGVLLGAEALTLPGGSGSAVLLIHGFAGSRRDFNDLGQRLQAEGHTVRMLRLPGHGTQPQDFAGVTPDQLRAHVAAEHAALAATHERVDVVGFSMGGALATLLAAEAAQRPASGAGDIAGSADIAGRPGRLVLIAPYFAVTPHGYYGLAPETWHRLLRPWLPYAVKSRYFVKLNQRENVDRLLTYRVVPAAAVDTALALGAAAADPATLARVRAPVLVLHAAGDDAADPAASRRALQGMTQAASRRYLDFGRSNHLLLWDYDRLAAEAEILRFLESSRATR